MPRPKDYHVTVLLLTEPSRVAFVTGCYDDEPRAGDKIITAAIERYRGAVSKVLIHISDLSEQNFKTLFEGQPDILDISGKFDPYHEPRTQFMHRHEYWAPTVYIYRRPNTSSLVSDDRIAVHAYHQEIARNIAHLILGEIDETPVEVMPMTAWDPERLSMMAPPMADTGFYQPAEYFERMAYVVATRCGKLGLMLDREFQRFIQDLGFDKDEREAVRLWREIEASDEAMINPAAARLRGIIQNVLKRGLHITGAHELADFIEHALVKAVLPLLTPAKDPVTVVFDEHGVRDEESLRGFLKAAARVAKGGFIPEVWFGDLLNAHAISKTEVRDWWATSEEHEGAVVTKRGLMLFADLARILPHVPPPDAPQRSPRRNDITTPPPASRERS